MHINGPKDIGHLIRSSRTDRGMTQGDLARQVGSTQRWISEIENGKETAEIGMVLRTLSLLGIAMHSGRPDPKPVPPTIDLAEAGDLDEIADGPGYRP